jgi:AAA domain-containing protein/phospholipase D-like protein
MTEGARPAWLNELIEVARGLCDARGEDAVASDDGGPVRIGPVSAAAGSGPGWFWLDPGGQEVGSDQLETAFLAPAGEPPRRRFQVTESAYDGNVLKVRVAAHAPAGGLFLWTARADRARLDRALLAGLSQISRFELAGRLVHGRADPIPGPDPAAAPAASLNADQARGRAACLAPGVQLIWGPPGTGKTTLIAAALGDLIARGQSVLLVSGADVAVDDALARAVKDLDPAPGVMVRVGTPQVADVAADPRICLQRIILDRQEQGNRARREVQEQIAARRRHPDVARLESALGELAGFDAAAYQAARQHIGHHDRLAELRALRRQLQQQAATSAGVLAAARARHARARRSWEESDVARQHLKAATELELELGNVALDRDQAIAEVAALQADRERLSAESTSRPGLAHRRERRLLAGRLADVTYRLQAAQARRQEAEQILASYSRQLTAAIEDHILAADPITDDEVAQRRIAYSTAQSDVRQAWNVQREYARQARELDEQIAVAERQPQPTAADLDLVARADESDLLRKLLGLPVLERQAGPVNAEIERLEERDGELVSQLLEAARSLRPGIIRQAKVVATTLATLCITPEASERDYDHVLIDEAACARLPEIVYAVSRATEGATLLGDFLQNGPPVAAQFAESADPAVQRWLHQDCFAVFGIHDPASAVASPGCVPLTQQYRFGPALNDLVNAAAYDGLLRVADGSTAAAGQEIVLVDVDGLGDELAAPRPGADGAGAWWPAGALVSAALAAWHYESSGQPVGIVTPGAGQAGLARGQLSGSGIPARIEVGSVRAFQDRGFDTAIFDLAGNGTGGVDGRRPPAARSRLDDLRVFTVGVTRAQRRLYLIGSQALVRASKAGPLHALAGLLDQGRARVLRVAGILGQEDEPAGDPAAAGLWHALRGHATLIDLHDEEYLPEELSRPIDQARERIWLWSPRVGQRPGEFVPHLAAAAGRGVRVHVIAVSPHEVSQDLQDRHDELSEQIPGVVFLRAEHQTVMVVDRDLTFIGSENVVIPPAAGRHEVIARLEGADLVQRMLQHELADVLADPPACPRCSAPVREAAARGGRWHWICRGTPGCGWTGPLADQGRVRR